MFLQVAIAVFGCAASDSFRIERHTLVLPERQAELVPTELAPAKQCNLVPAPLMDRLPILLNSKAGSSIFAYRVYPVSIPRRILEFYAVDMQTASFPTLGTHQCVLVVFRVGIPIVGRQERRGCFSVSHMNALPVSILLERVPQAGPMIASKRKDFENKRTANPRPARRRAVCGTPIRSIGSFDG